MVSHLLFYQLGLLVFVWLFLLLHLSGPSRAAPTAQPPAERAPIPPKRHRSTEPQAFAGLTHIPPCPLCDARREEVIAPMPIHPNPLPPTNRRPREIDTSMHFCPHEGCAYRGWLGLGNLQANGHPNGGSWRQFHCTSCGGYVLETHGTFFPGKRVAVELIVRV